MESPFFIKNANGRNSAILKKNWNRGHFLDFEHDIAFHKS